MSSLDLSRIFEELESSANELNAASEIVNETLSNVEQKLRRLNFGFEVWLERPLHQSDSTGGIGLHEKSTDFIDILGFAPVDGKWSLAVKRIKRVSGFYQGDEACPYTNEYADAAPALVINQSRNIRMSAHELLPDFLVLVLERIREKKQKISETSIKL